MRSIRIVIKQSPVSWSTDRGATWIFSSKLVIVAYYYLITYYYCAVSMHATPFSELPVHSNMLPTASYYCIETQDHVDPVLILCISVTCISERST